MSKRNKKMITGSGVLVVILSTLATSIYIISTFADYEHFNMQLDKYKSNLNIMYKEKVDNVDKVYSNLENKIKKSKNYSLN